MLLNLDTPLIWNPTTFSTCAGFWHILVQLLLVISCYSPSHAWLSVFFKLLHCPWPVFTFPSQKTEKNNAFDQLLMGKCSWSFLLTLLCCCLKELCVCMLVNMYVCAHTYGRTPLHLFYVSTGRVNTYLLTTVELCKMLIKQKHFVMERKKSFSHWMDTLLLCHKLSLICVLSGLEFIRTFFCFLFCWWSTFSFHAVQLQSAVLYFVQNVAENNAKWISTLRRILESKRYVVLFVVKTMALLMEELKELSLDA